MGYKCNKIYIGPAIKIKPKTRTVSENILSCSNSRCDNSFVALSTNFCAVCGMPVLACDVKREYTVSFHQFTQEEEYKKYAEDLFNPTHDNDGIWIPNRMTAQMSAFYGEIDERTITVSERFPENMESQLTIFSGIYDQMLTDMLAFGLEFETVYIIKTFGW